MTRLFSFRFDVDTHRCVREGMPALSRLGRRLDAPFTFFVNMGRAVSRPATLSALLGGGRSSATEASGAEPVKVAAKHPARRKLGTVGWLQAAILNPRVGAGSPAVLRGALADGHEVGLHGGRNHAVWQTEAAGWSPARAAAEIDAVLPDLERILGSTPAGFASPGWVTPPGLEAILAARGFRYLADEHGAPPAGSSRGARDGADALPGEPVSGAPLPSVRTALTGEPGGVAYLEHLDAAGLSHREALARFASDLDAAGDVAVVYDHPYWAGVRALRLVEEMVGIAREAGFDVVPVATVAAR